MPAGRPPKPTALKLVQGNPGRRPLPKNEPKPADGAPKPPRWLNADARRIWRGLVPHLEEMRVLTTADGTALALLSDAVAEYAAARAVLDDSGSTYETTTKEGSVMYRKRPEVEIAADAWRRISTMLVQFGLTPAARTKVQANEAKEVDPFEEFLNGGRNSG